MLKIRVFFPLLLIAVASWIGHGELSAQQSYDGVSTSVIEDQAKDLVAAEAYAQAVPALRELYNRLKDTEPDQEKLETIYYYLGIGYLASNRIDQGIEILKEYDTRFGENGVNRDNAKMFLGDAYRAKNKIPEAIEVYTRLLVSSQRARDVLNYRLEILEKLCEAYFYDRPEVQVEETRKDGKKVKVTKQRDPEWDKAIPLFQLFMRESNDVTKIAKIGSFLLQGYVAKGMLDEAFALIPSLLVESPTRYDILFNIALLEGGDRMYDSGKFSQASFFYALALSKEQIEAYFKNQLAILTSQKTSLESRAGTEKRVAELDLEIEITKEYLKTTEAVPNYTDSLKYRQARTYLGMERDWEAFWAFLRLWQELKDSPNAEDFLFTAFVQAVKVGQEHWAKVLGDAYQANPAYKEYNEQVIVSLVQLYHNIGQYDAFEKMAEDYIRKNPPDSAAANQLVYLLGRHLLDEGKLEKLDRVYKDLLKAKGATALYADGLLYWQGMMQLYTGDYKKLVEIMSQLVRQYPKSLYAEDATFRIGVGQYGEGDFAQARAHLEKFVRERPQSDLRSDAEALLGDIAASEGRVDDALAHFANVGKYAGKDAGMNNITHAAFQSAKLLEANKRYLDMIVVLNDYINTYRNEGDISNAIYQLGRAQELAGDIDASLNVYFDAIDRFGNDSSSEGIDFIVEALPEKYRNAKGEYPIKEFLDMYEAAVTDELWTKVFRLEAALQNMGHTVTPTYAISPTIIREASPGALVYLARRYAGDDTIFNAAYQTLAESYPDSEYNRFRYLDTGTKLAKAGDYEGALENFSKVNELFPASAEARTAALREGDALIALRRYDDAAAKFQDIQRTPSWRPVHGEALFKRALILQEQGKLPEAHALFQHTYLLYGSQKKWAAEAYLRAGEILESLGRRDEAKATYEDFMKNENFRDTEAYSEARTRLNRM